MGQNGIKTSLIICGEFSILCCLDMIVVYLDGDSNYLILERVLSSVAKAKIYYGEVTSTSKASVNKDSILTIAISSSSPLVIIVSYELRRAASIMTPMMLLALMRLMSPFDR